MDLRVPRVDYIKSTRLRVELEFGGKSRNVLLVRVNELDCQLDHRGLNGLERQNELAQLSKVVRYGSSLAS